MITMETSSVLGSDLFMNTSSAIILKLTFPFSLTHRKTIKMLSLFMEVRVDIMNKI